MKIIDSGTLWHANSSVLWLNGKS